jgi:Fe-S-cluster-containing dehydrogenase component
MSIDQAAPPGEEIKKWTCQECNKTIKAVSKWAHMNYVHGAQKKTPKKRKLDTDAAAATDVGKQLKQIVKDYLLFDCAACEHYACKPTCPMKSFRDRLRSVLQSA